MARRTDNNLATLSPEGETLQPFSPAMTAAMIPAEDFSETSAIDNLLAELGGITEDGAKVLVYRANPGNGRKVEAFLYECLPQEFSLTDLQQRYGTGDYRIRGYHLKGGRRTLFANQMVSIEAPAAPVSAPAPAPAPAPVSDPAALLSPIVSAMAQGFQELGRLIVQSAPKQPSRQEWLQELVMMRQVFGESKPGLDPSQIMALVQQGIEIGKGQTPPEDMEGAMMLETVKQIGPLLGSLAGKPSLTPAMPVSGGAPALPHVPSLAAPAAPVVASSAPAAAPFNPSPEQDMRPLIAYAVNMLVAQAERGADPALYAEVVADQLPEETINELLARPDWLEMLAGFNPKVREHSAWFLQLADALKTILTEEFESDRNEANNGKPA
jgi:hypothetical protein